MVFARKLFSFIGFVLLLGIVPTPKVYGEFAEGNILIVLDNAATKNSLFSLKAKGFIPVRAGLIDGKTSEPEIAMALRPKEITYLRVHYDPQIFSIDEALRRIRALPFVKAAEREYIFYPTYNPNDPRYPEQGNLLQGYFDEAWNSSKGDDIIVAVIDTGFRKQGMTDSPIHLLKGYDFWGKDEDPNDFIGHGTLVSNVIAEATNNGIGCAGAAFNAIILPCKVFPDSDGGAYEGDIIDAIYWATDQGARVANLSLGGGGYSSATKDAVDYALNKGMLLVAASGNDNADNISYPARYEGVVAVGSCKRHDPGDDPVRSDFSNWGEGLSLVAPGEAILGESFNPKSGEVSFEEASGTSLATPHASAAAALVFALDQSLKASDVFNILTSNAHSPYGEYDLEIGWGELDAEAAVEAAGGSGPEQNTNQPPVAKAKAEPSSGPAPLNVTLSSSGSMDPDGSLTQVYWTISNGDYITGSTATYLFKNPGEYTVTLTVKDNDGASSNAVISVVVTSNSQKDGSTQNGSSSKSGGCSIATSNDNSGMVILFGIILYLPAFMVKVGLDKKKTRRYQNTGRCHND